MIMMIINSDPAFRKHIKKTLRWAEYGYTDIVESGNDDEGLRALFSHQPHMVVMGIGTAKPDGLDLMLKARNGGFTGIVIVVSRHARFEFAQRAIRCGVDAFFKKPVKKKELAEAVNRLRPAESDKSVLLYELLNGRPSPATTESLSWDMYQTAVLRFNAPESREQFMQALRSNTRHAYDDMLKQGDNGLVCLLAGKPGARHFNRHVQKSASEDTGFVSAVISRETDNAADLVRLHQEVEYVAERLFYFINESKIIYCADNAHQKNAAPPQIDWDMGFDTLRGAVIAGESETIHAWLAALALYLRHSGDSPQKITGIYMRLCLRMEQAIHTLYPEIIDQPDYENHLRTLGDMTALWQMAAYMLGYCTNLAGQIKNGPGENIASKVCHYIDKHYAEPLKLSALAEALNYNSTYLGRAFKQHTGRSFNAHLEKVRVENAMKRLTDTTDKIVTVAEAVGFADIDYFCRRFKQLTGQTPGEYRKNPRP